MRSAVAAITGRGDIHASHHFLRGFWRAPEVDWGSEFITRESQRQDEFSLEVARSFPEQILYNLPQYSAASHTGQHSAAARIGHSQPTLSLRKYLADTGLR